MPTQSIQIQEKALEGLPHDVVAQRLKYLVELFGDQYSNYFPAKIPDQGELLKLVHMSFALEYLSGSSGFALHLEQYRNDVSSNHLVLVLADYLAARTSGIELEPEVGESAKRADVAATIGSSKVFFECKNPQKEVFEELRLEQEPMYQALLPFISRPCDVFVTYREPLSESDLLELGDFLRTRLPLVTSEGVILDTGDLRVEVTNPRESFRDIGEIQIQLVLENYHAKERNPVNMINRGGVPIAFIKRGVSVIKNLESQLRASRHKASIATPLVVVVRSEYLTGSLDENVSNISRLFQPTKNTSFNGVLLIRWSYESRQLLHYEFTYVNNPYARNPTSSLGTFFPREAYWASTLVQAGRPSNESDRTRRTG
jgi:hypothetical protein